MCHPVDIYSCYVNVGHRKLVAASTRHGLPLATLRPYACAEPRGRSRGLASIPFSPSVGRRSCQGVPLHSGW